MFLCYNNKNHEVLCGVKIHYDEPNKTLGEETFTESPAESIHILTSNLLNSTPTKRDEHYISIIEKDETWDINTETYEKAYNADCVSQMMAWALCRSVENSMQNHNSDHYIPRQSFQELIPELQSIQDSFSEDQLATNPEWLEEERRRLEIERQNAAKRKLEHERYDKAIKELEVATTYDDVISIFDKYSTHNLVYDVIYSLEFLTDQEKKDLLAYSEQKIKEQKQKTLSEQESNSIDNSL